MPVVPDHRRAYEPAILQASKHSCPRLGYDSQRWFASRAGARRRPAGRVSAAKAQGGPGRVAASPVRLTVERDTAMHRSVWLWHDSRMPYLVPPVVPAGRMSSRPQPSLCAGDLILRPWTRRDVAPLMSAYGDAAIQRWHARTVDSPREALQLINSWLDGWTAETSARWAVVDAVDEVMGQVALRDVDFQEGEAELSYWVVPHSRRRGVATESVRTLTQWSFDELGLDRLELHHSLMNDASCRVADGAGFALEGTMYQKAVHLDGRHDMHLHARVRMTSPEA